ncbi:MAG TPA: ATP synthase F0 subunit C [Acetivibrio sp.]|jgi:F-type H+-transporting ATPase subunit c|nr:ATP synthase F0 subunit C [Clostridium sp.]HQA56602.1 ATP synthase F0 subunit C [Acetivibrio sp.]
MTGITALAASFCVLTGAAAGIGISVATSKAVQAVARQPEAGDKIRNIIVLGAALAEATAVYAFIIALLMVLVK